MCADFCIHDTDGHNPHAHIMLTVRPLDENGKWQSKTEKEYLCIKNGEERGFTSERCEINRQIKADNKLLREIKESVKKLAQAVIDTLPKLADTLETIRKNIMIAAYHMLHSRYRKKAVGDKIKTTADNIQKYKNTLLRLKAKVKDKKATAEQKKTTSFLNIPKQRELTKLLNTQTEEIEELKTEKSMLLKEDLLKEKNSLLNKLRKLQYHQKHEQRAERKQKQYNRDDWDMEL